jgi:hypothetical protein
MTFTERLLLLFFGLITWCAGMVTAAATTVTPVAITAPAMAGIGAVLFVAALLPGRTARFL